MLWITADLDSFGLNVSLAKEPMESRAAIKAFGELSLAYAVINERVSAIRDLELRGVIRDQLAIWKSFILKEMLKPEYLDLMHKIPSSIDYYLLPYLTIRREGRYLEEFERALQSQFLSGLPSSFELVPYLQLDRAYFNWKSGLQVIEPNWLALYRATGMAKSRNLVGMTSGDAYNITHTIFYITDFGKKAPPFSQAEKRRVLRLLHSLLVHFWRTGFWDVVGELLLNALSMRSDPSYLYVQASNSFFNSSQMDDGSFIPKSSHLKRLNNRQTQGRFSQNYHTTLVGAMFATAVVLDANRQ